jgi:hypothetical protein
MCGFRGEFISILCPHFYPVYMYEEKIKQLLRHYICEHELDAKFLVPDWGIVDFMA